MVSTKKVCRSSQNMFLYTLLVETIALVALIVLVVQWSVKYFFAPNFPIFRKSCKEEEDGENRQMQSVLLFKQTQKAWPE